jgi:type I restriction enzyme S subunit
MVAASSPVWETRSLREVVTKLVDGSHNPPPKQEAGLPMLSARNIDRGQVLFDDYRLISEGAFVSENARTRIAAGDVLLTIVGTIGRTAVVPEGSQPFSLQRSVAVLTPAANLLPKFLCYQLQSPAIQKHFEANARGTAQKGVYLKTLGQTPIVLPPVQVQTEIVAEIEKQFSRLDEAVANLQRVKVNLKRYKASVLKDAVEGRLVPLEAELARREGRSFETGEQLLQRILETRRRQWKGKGKFKDSTSSVTANLPTIPEGWTWATMPQIGELNRGKSKHRPRDDVALYGGPYPFIQTGDVRRSAGSITEYSQTYTEFGLKQSRLWPFGTLCITIAANIAETGILKLEACFPDSVVGFVSDQGYPTTEYVEFFIRTARDGLDRFASATAQKNINLEVLEAVAVPIPPLAEQRRIVAEVDRRLSLIRGVEAEVDANLKRAQALRQASLTKAFQQKS